MTAEVAVVALVAVLLGALLKSITGVGLPLITIPAISYVADIETAVAVTAVPNFAVNAALSWRERQSIDTTRDLPILAIAGLAGAVLGTLLLVSLPENPLIALLLAMVIVYAINFFRRPEFEISRPTARRFAPAVGLATGAMQGAVGISAPILVPWLHSYRLPRDTHVFSVTALFAVAGVAQILTLTAGDALDGRWTVALVACLPALATIPIGERLRGSLTTQGFDRFVVISLSASVLVLALRTFL